MKTYILNILMIMLVAVGFTQVPNNISYQAVIRKGDGSIVVTSKVGFKFSIHQNSANGTMVYEETQLISTNRDGLATLRIGAGTPTVGNFSTINWSTGVFFVKTKIDVTGGTNYVLSATAQLSSVPYAFYASEAASVDYTNVKHAPDVTLMQNSSDSLQNEIDSLLVRVKLLEQTNVVNDGLTVKDIDGNVYPLVVIGSQVWMAENLNVTKFNDGTPLTEVKDFTWDSRTDPIYCWTNNDSIGYSSLHAGLYYNGYTAFASKNICPIGFRLPTLTDFTILRTFLGVDVPTTDPTFAAKNAAVFQKLSSNNEIIKWNVSSGQNPTNFNALPMGTRANINNVVSFIQFNREVQFMTSTNLVPNADAISPATFSPTGLNLDFTTVLFLGFPIRCIKQ